MLPSASSTLPESSRKPVGFLMLSGGIKVNGAAVCYKSNTYKSYCLYQSAIISYQFSIQWHCFYLSPLWVFPSKLMIILLISFMFLNKKTDFQVIKFLNLNFRFPLGSVSKCKIYDFWIFICYFMSIVHCFCMTSC